MKQQFFVGDVVRLNQLGLEAGNRAVQEDDDYDLWNSKYLLMLKQQGTAVVSEPALLKVWLEGNAFFVSPEHLEVVERAWQKNTGKQPVDDDVEVFVKYIDGTVDYAEASMFDWGKCQPDGSGISEWHIADSVSSNEEQPEAIPPSHVALGEELVSTDVPTQQEWTDKHYDNNYTLTQKDIERGFVKIDPYRVSKQWRLGSKDESGVLFHILKTVARFGEKNSREREIKALYAQIKCLAEIEGVSLNE